MTWAVSFYRRLAQAGCVYGVPRRVCQGEVEAQVWTVGVSQTGATCNSECCRQRSWCLQSQRILRLLVGREEEGACGNSRWHVVPLAGITRASVGDDSTLERWSGRGEEALIAIL